MEALLCRLTGEAWLDQNLPGPQYCPNDRHNVGEHEQQAGFFHPGNPNICFTQVLHLHFFCLLHLLKSIGRDNDFLKYLQLSSANITRAEALSHDPRKEHLYKGLLLLKAHNDVVSHDVS